MSGSTSSRLTGRPLEALALRTSHPLWVVKALRAALIGHGRTTAESVDGDLGRLLESDNAPAKVSIAARPGLSTVAELLDAGAVAWTVSPVGAVLPEGDPGAIPAIREDEPLSRTRDPSWSPWASRPWRSAGTP